VEGPVLVVGRGRSVASTVSRRLSMVCRVVPDVAKATEAHEAVSPCASSYRSLRHTLQTSFSTFNDFINLTQCRAHCLRQFDTTTKPGRTASPTIPNHPR